MIAELFNQYCEITGEGNTTAAAVLTLADVLSQRPADTTAEPATTLTVAEAAGRLQVSENMVYDLCRAGKLGHSRIGKGRGVIRIPPAELDTIRQNAARRKQKPSPPAELNRHARGQRK